MNKKIFVHVKKFLPLIGIVIFLYLIFSLDVNKIIDALFSIHPLFIVISLSLTIPRLILRNFAWQLIIKEQKISLSCLQSLKIFLIGFFYGSITPSYMGQLMRVPYMKEKTGEPYGKLFVNSMLELIIHTLSLYGMMLFGAFLIISTSFELFSIVIVWIISIVIVLLFFIKKERGEKLFFTLIKYLVPGKLKHSFNKFVSTFYKDFPRVKKLFLPLFIGLFTWIIIFTQEYIFVYALDVNIPYVYFLVLFPIANTAGFLPITFAGLGTREFTSIFIFSTLFGVEVEKIFVFTLLGFIITDLFTGFIGFILSLTESRKAKEQLSLLK
jgi:uncharacterized protein (TIRG00374 family)